MAFVLFLLHFLNITFSSTFYHPIITFLFLEILLKLQATFPFFRLKNFTEIHKQLNLKINCNKHLKTHQRKWWDNLNWNCLNIFLYFNYSSSVTLISNFNSGELNVVFLTKQTKPGCYVSNVPDKVIIPGVYETADEKFARRLEKVRKTLLIY